MVAVVASGVDTPGHARTGELCSGRADGAADWWLYMRHLAVLETLATRASAGNKMVIIILFDHTTHTHHNSTVTNISNARPLKTEQIFK